MKMINNVSPIKTNKSARFSKATRNDHLTPFLLDQHWITKAISLKT